MMVSLEIFYNDIDHFCVQWLKNLIKDGLLLGGIVDERDIKEIQTDDVMGFKQCHFFAGIGGWPYALQLAEWPKDWPVWTGSCPCQPFSIAGKRGGFEDERHLWPAWFRLIKECKPPVIFGEQVASPAGRSWLSVVRSDLEEMEYAVGCADLCAAGVGAPHIRQRLWFGAIRLADSPFGRRKRKCGEGKERIAQHGQISRMADSNLQRLNGEQLLLQWGKQEQEGFEITRGSKISNSTIGYLANAMCTKLEEREIQSTREEQQTASRSNGLDIWDSCGWVYCRDGRLRPIEPGTFPLAYGVPQRVGRLRAYGNAIVPQVGAMFIRAFMEAVAVLER